MGPPELFEEPLLPLLGPAPRDVRNCVVNLELAGPEEKQGDFAQSARVQEIINAVELSHRERGWISLPFDL